MKELPKEYKRPFRYCPEGQMIFDGSNALVLNVRSWGHLTGKGALGLPESEAETIQDKLGEFVAEAMNRDWQPISTAPKDGTVVILGHWNYCDGWAWEQTLASWDKSFLMWHTVGYNNPHTHWHPISDPPRRGR